MTEREKSIHRSIKKVRIKKSMKKKKRSYKQTNKLRGKRRELKVSRKIIIKKKKHVGGQFIKHD